MFLTSIDIQFFVMPTVPDTHQEILFNGTVIADTWFTKKWAGKKTDIAH